jgi:four helix bundle protein
MTNPRYFFRMSIEYDFMPWQDSERLVLHEDSEQVSQVQVFDLEERTARFGESVIEFCKAVPLGPRTNRLVDQLTGSGTSVGANYCEADDAISKKEFAHLIGTCRKEARETLFFIRMIAKACPELRGQARQLWCEAHELHLIFAKIRRTTLQNLAKQP